MRKEKSLDKSEMEKKENVGINSETRQIGVLKGFDEQDCFKISYPKNFVRKNFKVVQLDQTAFGYKNGPILKRNKIWPL